MKTLFIDIDGTLIEQNKPVSQQIIEKNYPETTLPGVIEKFHEWERLGYKIILTTGRKECWRKFTEEQLFSLGIWYDQLVMDAGSGQRILINDLKPNYIESSAAAICLSRNKGIADITL